MEKFVSVLLIQLIISICSYHAAASSILKREDLQNNCNFIKTENHCLYGHNDLVVEGVSERRCKDLCVSQNHFDCLSFDYLHQIRSCQLSSSDRHTKPNSFGSHFAAHYFEKQCDDVKTTTSPPCTSTQFRCHTSGRCINLDKVCDEESDCLDGSDEVGCSHHRCDENEFMCPPNGICIPARWVCDGENDCIDGDDEKVSECPNLRSLLSKRSNHVSCRGITCAGPGGKDRCVPDEWICDGVWDCMDGWDELGCF